MDNMECPISIIGVVGEGKMGTAIFNHFLDHGYSMRWLCSERADVLKLRRQAERRLSRRADGSGHANLNGPAHSLFSICSSMSVIMDCQLIIEAIPEVLTMKSKFFREIDGLLSDVAIITSNSSSFLPSLLAQSICHKRRFCGFHFFYPLEFKRFAEIIPGPETDPAIPGILDNLLRQTGMTGLLLNEPNGFLLNRIMLDVEVAAWNLVEAGRCTIGQLDEWVSQTLFPSGIFTVMDQIGLDTMLTAIMEYVKNYPFKDPFQPLILELQRLTDSGRTGKKSGRGFYPEQLNSMHSPETEQVPKEEIIRFLRETWLSSCKRAAMTSRIPIPDLNMVIRDYFDQEKGPFE